MWQTALPCSWVMGSLEGSPTLEVGPEGLQALDFPLQTLQRQLPDCAVSLQVAKIQQQQVGEGLA